MSRDLVKQVFVILVWMAGFHGFAKAETGFNFRDRLQVSGYFQASPLAVWLDLPEPVGNSFWKEYRLQNRLNLRLDMASNLTFHWQMRTRIFAGDLVKDFPRHTKTVTDDNGLLDLSWTVFEEDDWILHYISDRLYMDWDRGDWNVRLGRQRVNWGINILTNPNDIFNLYSVYNFDYLERPGSDTLRIQRFMGFASRLELAVNPGRESEDSVAAALYAFRSRGYDVQVIGGYYRERFATGAGWAGNLGKAGLKGETMYFAGGGRTDGNTKENFILATSIDYMFPSSTFLVAEILYNQKGGRDVFDLTAERLSPDNPSFSKLQMALRLTYPITPLVRTAFTMIAYPDRDSMFFSPALTWSIMENLDFKILGQFLLVGENPVSGSSASLFTASLKYNF